MKTPTQVEIDVAIGMIKNPTLLNKLTLIKTFKKTINDEIKKGVFVLSLAKKKLDKIFISAKAITPYPKYISAEEVIFTSSGVKDP